MQLTAKRINTFMFFKLPAAYWCGVRAKAIDGKRCLTIVRHRWFNQNPFRSIYFAVLSMAAELSTGALVMLYIRSSGKNVSMLVAATQAEFTKKATGKITFSCQDGPLIAKAIDQAISTGLGQVCRMQSVGFDEKGEQVALFHFEWTVKLKA